MSVLSNSTHICSIVRFVESQDSDVRSPTVTETVLAASIPCRFDRVAGRRRVAEVTTAEIRGRLFIDASVLKSVKPQEEDVVDIAGERGRFAIDRIDPVYSTVLHHYEIDLVDYQPS